MTTDGTDGRHHRRLDRAIEGVARRLPAGPASWLRHLRVPSARWLRLPLGVLLVVGGLLEFLPVLGVWMLPLGLALLAYDIPALKAPVGWVLVRSRRLWRKLLRRRPAP